MEDILDDPAIMKEGIDAMTVAMLKGALKARGLKRTGLKADLNDAPRARHRRDGAGAITEANLINGHCTFFQP